MVQLGSFKGIIRDIQDFHESSCVKFVTIQIDDENIVNFIIEPTTFVLDQEMLSIGDIIVAFYDLSLPVIAIYPPRYKAEYIVKVKENESAYISYFDVNLISHDHQLQLNISDETKVVTMNGQLFNQNIANQFLMILYDAATKSIPAQVNPIKVVVLQC